MNTMIEASSDLKTLIVTVNDTPYHVYSHETGQPYPITDGNGRPVNDPEVFKTVKRAARFYLHNVMCTTYLDYTRGL